MKKYTGAKAAVEHTLSSVNFTKLLALRYTVMEPDYSQDAHDEKHIDFNLGHIILDSKQVMISMIAYRSHKNSNKIRY